MADVTSPDEPRPEPKPEKTFNKAAQEKSATPPPQQNPSVESEQVKNTQLGLQDGPKAPGETRKAVVNQVHNQKMAKDDNKSKAASSERLEALKKFNQQAKERNQAKSNTKDKDLGR